MNQQLIHVLLKAKNIIAEKGLAKQMHCNPVTGEVDIDGAILLACGAKNLPILVENVFDYIPVTAAANYTQALWLLDAELGQDVQEWNDLESTTQEDALKLLSDVTTGL